MSPLGIRKPVRTYSRSRKRSLHEEEPPTKRRRVDANTGTVKGDNAPDAAERRRSQSTSPLRELSALPTSSPKACSAIFSDESSATPPTSPALQQSSPPIHIRRPVFLSLKRRADSTTATKAKLFSERSPNVQTPANPRPKKKRLVQMQLDLVGELRKKCTVCGMEYIPSNTEDAALHRKFHGMNLGGVDFTKAVIEKLKQNQVWAGGNGSFIAVIGRKDSLALRRKASEVLKVVNTELAAVTVPEEALWSQMRIPVSGDASKTGGKGHTLASGDRTSSANDRFKVYLYIRANKCVGACLAERIHEAYAVRAQDDASQPTRPIPAEHDSSSISIGTTTEPAILGISRIWTSSLFRKHGVATRLLDTARSDFLYGMTIERDLIAFSQPTESGGQLARKWFGRRAGWHVYID